MRLLRYPYVRVMRARDLIARAMRAASSVLLLQTLAEFSNVAIRKARIPVKDIRKTIDAWCAVLPVQAADDSDLFAALEAVRAHRLAFWDARRRVIDLVNFHRTFFAGCSAFWQPFKRSMRNFRQSTIRRQSLLTCDDAVSARHQYLVGFGATPTRPNSGSSGNDEFVQASSWQPNCAMVRQRKVHRG
jgi:hypothetical protein